LTIPPEDEFLAAQGRFHVPHVRRIWRAILSGSAPGIGSNFCSRPAKQSARYRLPSGKLLQLVEKRNGSSQDYHTRDQARSEIFEYIKLFYNRRRLHQSLAYQPPMKDDSTGVDT
jgi:hypothetical protein